MLIQSSFSDYYDGVASSGIDTTIRYRRETTKLKAESPFMIDHLPRDFLNDAYPWEHNFTFNLIGFCGVQIVTLTHGDTVHFGEEILALKWSTQKRHRKPSNYQVVTDCMQRFNQRSDNTLFQKFNVPVFITDILSYPTNYEFKHPGLYLPTFTLNPQLSGLKFYQYKDAYSAFQDIQSYISGVLGVDTQPTIELSDKSKIIKAGFDPKTSFRKGKQPPK
jgi:hypothetical protein